MKAVINSNLFYELNRLIKSDFIEVLVTDTEVNLIAENEDVQVILESPSLGNEEKGVKIVPNYLFKMFDKDVNVEFTGDSIKSSGIEIKATADVAAYDLKKVDCKCDDDLIYISSMENATNGKYALAKDSSRPVLRNMAIRGDCVYAIDGYRLSKTVLDMVVDDDVLISDQVIKIISKLKGATPCVIAQDYKNIEFNFGKVRIITKRTKEEFIKNINSLIPSEFKTHIKASSEELKRAFKKADILFKENSGLIKMLIDNGETSFIVETRNLKVNSKIVAEVDGDDLTICFKPKYMLDALSRYKGNIDLYFKGDVEPIIIKKDDKLDLVLPVRLRNK